MDFWLPSLVLASLSILALIVLIPRWRRCYILNHDFEHLVFQGSVVRLHLRLRKMGVTDDEDRITGPEGLERLRDLNRRNFAGVCGSLFHYYNENDDDRPTTAAECLKNQKVRNLFYYLIYFCKGNLPKAKAICKLAGKRHDEVNLITNCLLVTYYDEQQPAL